jgi:NADP-dependent 3-hydroxy acid dehydrogenase YdfG
MILAISGGTSGLGAAVADEASARGWSVLCGSRRTGLDVRD